ncbi:MAG: RluA family pseudouridine synthase, partial [Dehalococcoidia bacterium]|nr:RluA family pseudouridine synthase [Dehalococcoidia bacterium]
IVHRLDKDTSGLVSVAKNQQAYAALTEALAERRVKKRYLAIATGTGLPREGRIEGAIGRDPAHRQRMAIREGGRDAATAFTVLAEGAGASLVEARPETGRTHQIRVHFASIRHPLVGDRLYGGTGAERQMLHAWRLGFEHPATGEWLDLEAAPPEDFVLVAEGLALGSGI